MHDAFDRLDIWFTATVRINSKSPEFVSFSSPDPEKLPLPKPVYLHIYIDLSGASEYIEKILRNLEEILVLRIITAFK